MSFVFSLALMVSPGLGAEGQVFQISSSISANLVFYNQREPKNKTLSKIILSSSGLKLKSKSLLAEDRGGEYVQNFNVGRSWIIDREKKVYASLPESDDAEESDMASGIMATRPCLAEQASSVEKKLLAKESLNGLDVLVWECNHSGIVSDQYFSEKYSLVIREVMQSLDVAELENIKSVEFSEEFFLPPNNYREVTLEELYTGSPKLESY